MLRQKSEKESKTQREAVYAQWRAEGEAKRQAEIKAEREKIKASGMDLHTYTMTNYYNERRRYYGD